MMRSPTKGDNMSDPLTADELEQAKTRLLIRYYFGGDEQDYREFVQATIEATAIAEAKAAEAKAAK